MDNVHPLTGAPLGDDGIDINDVKMQNASSNSNPWLSVLFWIAIGAGSLGIILSIVGANATPTWENPTAGVAASVFGMGLASLGMLAAIGFVTARAVIWETETS